MQRNGWLYLAHQFHSMPLLSLCRSRLHRKRTAIEMVGCESWDRFAQPRCIDFQKTRAVTRSQRNFSSWHFFLLFSSLLKFHHRCCCSRRHRRLIVNCCCFLSIPISSSCIHCQLLILFHVYGRIVFSASVFTIRFTFHTPTLLLNSFGLSTSAHTIFKNGKHKQSSSDWNDVKSICK